MAEKLFELKGLKKYFPTENRNEVVKAVDDVSFDIYQGETIGIVGESGCGKSTLGRLVLKLLDLTDGELTYKGDAIEKYSKKKMRKLRRELQIIFQDPFASLDPRKNVLQILSEPFEIHEPLKSKKEVRKRVEELINLVGLRLEHINRYPHEFSGGQRQRIGIARAIALNPKFIVCDEPVSALDVSIQAQVINLLNDIKEEFNLTYFFISHDLRVVKHFCDRIVVMYLGSVMEISDRKTLYEKRRHPYTKALLSAIPSVSMIAEDREDKIILKGDIPSPINPPSGCPFHTRCPYAMEECKSIKPALRKLDDGSQIACHLYKKTQ